MADFQRRQRKRRAISPVLHLPIALLATASILLLGHPAEAQQKALEKVKIAIGTPAMNLTYPWVEMPIVLNYWRDEGYDVSVFAGGSSLQSIQVMSAGNVDFAEVNSAPLIQALNTNDIQMRDVMLNTVIDWSVVVSADGPYKSIKDLKGKLVGVSSLGSGAVGLLQSYLNGSGLDPKAVTLVAVGAGPTALQALNSDRVQGLMFWGSANASFEVMGAKLRYFYDPRWRKYPDFSLSAMQTTIAKNPKMVEAIVRGAAKASLFAVTNPDCVRKLQWQHFPDTKPTGDSEENLTKADDHRLDAQLDSLKLALALGGGKLWGRVTPEQFSKLEDFLIDTKLIDHKIANPADYIVGIPDFWTKVNDFDHAAVLAQAKACRVS
jgi:NitT/TauT family transport system substrate-binding protein